MSLYSRYIFPMVLEFSLDRPEIRRLREDLLMKAEGRLLEIGFGTGLNLPHYPSQIRALTVVDPNPGMQRHLKKRLERSRIHVEQHLLRGEKLPFPDQSFDTAVSTFSLCSIRTPQAALAEIHRVLVPGGKFLFLEHGLADREKIQIWQRRLNPFQKLIGDGCHLDRNIGALIQSAGLQIVELKNAYLPKLPKVVGYYYWGVARKPMARTG